MHGGARVLLAILIKGMTLAGIYFMISFGVTFLYGVGGFPNLAIGPIGLAGAYVTATLIRSSMHPIWAIWVGLGCSILVLPYGILEMVRTGLVAMVRGSGYFSGLPFEGGSEYEDALALDEEGR